MGAELSQHEQAVVDDARAGDPEAFAALYRSIAPAVLGYLRGHGAADPEDLASEVFVGVVRGLHRFVGSDDDFRSWVFTIAHRRLLDDRRRRRRHPEQLLSDPAADVAARWQPGPEELAVERSFATPALRALRALTPDQRSVLLLRVVADLPVAEVARILGKQEGAVKTLQRRALAALSRAIAPEAVS